MANWKNVYGHERYLFIVRDYETGKPVAYRVSDASPRFISSSNTATHVYKRQDVLLTISADTDIPALIAALERAQEIAAQWAAESDGDDER